MGWYPATGIATGPSAVQFYLSSDTRSSRTSRCGLLIGQIKSSGACRLWCTPASAVEPRPIGGPGVRHGALVGLTHLGGVFGEKPRLVAGRQRPPGGAAGGDFRIAEEQV